MFRVIVGKSVIELSLVVRVHIDCQFRKMHISIALQCQLLNAIQDNDLELAEDLLRRDAVDPDTRFLLGSENQVPAICLCVERGLYEMAKLLVEYGCSINQVDSCGYTPLHLASSHQFIDLVRLLIHHRANVNAVSNYGHTPLHLAAQQSSVGNKHSIN